MNVHLSTLSLPIDESKDFILKGIYSGKSLNIDSLLPGVKYISIIPLHYNTGFVVLRRFSSVNPDVFESVFSL